MSAHILYDTDSLGICTAIARKRFCAASAVIQFSKTAREGSLFNRGQSRGKTRYSIVGAMTDWLYTCFRAASIMIIECLFLCIFKLEQCSIFANSAGVLAGRSSGPPAPLCPCRMLAMDLLYGTVASSMSLARTLVRRHSSSAVIERLLPRRLWGSMVGLSSLGLQIATFRSAGFLACG